MSDQVIEVAALEELREAGDFDKLGAILPDAWDRDDSFDPENIRHRLLAAELSGRAGRLDDMEAILAPYLDGVDRVPYGLASRVLLALGTFYYRKGEPSEALRLARLGETVAAARDEDFTRAEALQLAGQALWSLERWEEALEYLERTVAEYASQNRSYRLGLGYLCLGGVLNRSGRIEEARTALERSIKILLKCRDPYTLAVARVNVATPLNLMGGHETALDYLRFALEMFERVGHDQYTYLTLNAIAATLVQLREYDAAERHIVRALELGAETRTTQIAATYEIKARLHIARREYEAAQKALDASIEIAAQANSNLQRAEARRTQGRLLLAGRRDDEAAAVLWEALELARALEASLLEVEIKALLVQAICVTDPMDACDLLSSVETALKGRRLPELKKAAVTARRQIDSLDHEHFFVLSDSKVPLLADAKLALLKWLWARALHKARGNAREAARLLGVTPTYIRKLTKVIPRDLLRPGRKRSKQKTETEPPDPR